MARKFGKTSTMSENFYDYNYIINGVAAIGKTHLAHHLGIEASGSNEGTFIITCGREPNPSHIPNNPFWEHAKTFNDVIDIVDDITTNRTDYPNTKFICFDSTDELYRICEDYVVAEWNNRCDINDRAKSISQAYKGFQKGENRVCSLVTEILGKINDAGLHFIFIGHTKTKTTTDMYSGVSFEQITCSVDNKYYNLIKDKVNLVATCYYEKEIADIEEVKDAFTKKMKKKGNLISQHKVIVFVDDDNAIDTKSHFAHIVPKIDFDVKGFITAIEDALKKQSTNPVVPKSTPVVQSTSAPEIDDNDIDDEPVVDKSTIITNIRAKFKTADASIKAKVKEILATDGNGKLDDSLDIEVLNKIASLL